MTDAGMFRGERVVGAFVRAVFLCKDATRTLKKSGDVSMVYNTTASSPVQASIRLRSSDARASERGMMEEWGSSSREDVTRPPAHVQIRSRQNDVHEEYHETRVITVVMHLNGTRGRKIVAPVPLSSGIITQ
jgi:hypothetical protein